MGLPLKLPKKRFMTLKNASKHLKEKSSIFRKKSILPSSELKILRHNSKDLRKEPILLNISRFFKIKSVVWKT